PATDKPTDPTENGLCGDVDESGKVDIIDVIALNKNLMIGEKISEQGMRNAITTKEKNRNPEPLDSLNILKYVVEIYPSLPV
ncbi:MAG: hypothetical protein IKN55_08865, partial [Oscillospiraceae bacterium]|nr:hypothetical protein [Oscillospiraceae bacterium]